MRVHHVAKCRKSPGSCRCGKKIKPGEPYKWAKGRYGPRMVRCGNCRFRGSELTGSDKLSRVYAAGESGEDSLDGWDGDSLDSLRPDFESIVSDLNEVADEYQESAENIRNTFSESAKADECEEKADNIRSWAEEIESAVEELDEFDEEAVRKEILEELEGTSVPLTDEIEEETLKTKKAEWAEQVRDSLLAALGNCPL